MKELQSAASKKKKKEKEKVKKAAAAVAAETKKEVKNDTRSKEADTKLPKHVRLIHKALDRHKEAEERSNKEEEERLRKEEEERRDQEELARQAEDARLKKKEKEKEKLRKRKEAGLLLTPKQKEEQRREIMRNQFLANAGMKVFSSDINGSPTKCPIYTTKKPKTKQKSNDLKAQTLEDK